MDEPLPPGLYVVATPIGNLGDLSPRAAETLRRAERILAEDKRVSAKLLAHVGASAPMSVYHDHSGEAEREAIVARLGNEAIALICDAGTPLISDPGYKLVRAARAAGHAVHTVPGPCAAIAALTLAGLPTDRFLFAGFLPPKAKARSDAIAEIAAIRATLVFYESGPRLGGTCPSHNCERRRYVDRNTQRTGLRTTDHGNSGSNRTSRLRDLAHTAGWQLGGELEQGGGGSGELSVRQLSGWRPLADEPDVVSEVLLARLVRT